jgi:hypothetical protein
MTRREKRGLARLLVVGGLLVALAFLLWDVSDLPARMYPHNQALRLLEEVLFWAACAVLLAGLALLLNAWRRADLPPIARLDREVALALGVEGAAIASLTWFAGDLRLVMLWMAVPLAFTGFVFVKLREARQASGWVEGRGRITVSQLRQKHRRNHGGFIEVADVQYEFIVDGVARRGERIGIGEIDTAGGLLKRFPVGAEVAVFYDPQDPERCVLDRSVPASGAAIWSVAVGAQILGAAAIAIWSRTGDVDAWISRWYQGGMMGAIFLAGGAFMLVVQWLVWRQASVARSWPIAEGRITASGTESFASRMNHRSVKLHRAAIEYADSVEGREWRGSRVAMGGREGSGEKRAGRLAARYPVGASVRVYYDPADASNAVLEPRAALSWLILAFAGVLLFLGAAPMWPR